MPHLLLFRAQTGESSSSLNNHTIHPQQKPIHPQTTHESLKNESLISRFATMRSTTSYPFYDMYGFQKKDGIDPGSSIFYVSLGFSDRGFSYILNCWLNQKNELLQSLSWDLFHVNQAHSFQSVFSVQCLISVPVFVREKERGQSGILAPHGDVTAKIPLFTLQGLTSLCFEEEKTSMPRSFWEEVENRTRMSSSPSGLPCFGMGFLLSRSSDRCTRLSDEAFKQRGLSGRCFAQRVHGRLSEKGLSTSVSSITDVEFTHFYVGH
ncbi:unnamed protein product [Sphenostylis stenocarpa]|uniref:Uncharacterized protein n=1 Tax=Sphenostylis stenocarpa TaxID=92480 RepID=A0AA87B8D6_9FABA|nr:unnamed protein product [Sphenostylis stenocarpa]